MVIGTGAAGQGIAYKCQSAGWKVAIVDSRPFGGTCGLRGCDPKKVLVGAAEAVDQVNRPTGIRFQPDIFDSVPSDDDYSPLRTIQLVIWTEDATPRLLGNVEAIQVAETAGELLIEPSGIVVNMPILVWPDGQR